MTERNTVYNNPDERVSSSGDLQVITPADGVEFVYFTRAIILLDGDGSMVAVDAKGQTVTFTAGELQNGVQYSFELQEIKDAGTGATRVLGMF